MFKNGLTNKHLGIQFYDLGFTGNKGINWVNYRDYIKSEFEGLVVIRSNKKYGGGFCFYNLTRKMAILKIEELLKDHPPESIWVNAQMPDTKILLQGEFTWASDLYYINNKIVRPGEAVFFGSTEKTQMRTALKGDNTKYYIGLNALLTLKHYMWSNTYEMFREIADHYHDHVLEISIYDIAPGIRSNHNAIIWEVRKY